MAQRELRIGLIGYNFMGKAHSQAWRNAPLYFDMGVTPVLKVVCGRSKNRVRSFAARWGWEDFETDWRRVIERDDIDVIDVSTPTFLHHDMVIAAAEAGKHIFCEKPSPYPARKRSGCSMPQRPPASPTTSITITAAAQRCGSPAS